MKTILKIFILSALSIFLVAGTATAIPLGTNITISDRVNTGGTGWYSDREDEEVEPGCITGQQWDLEGFFLDGTMLTMVGGFDFKEGQGGYQSGDIFIDTNGDAKYGPDNQGTGGDQSYPAEITNTFNYEYAIDLNFLNNLNTFTVYALNGNSTVRVYYNDNDESNPWEYVPVGDGSDISSTGSINFMNGNIYDSDLTDYEIVGGTHYAVALDLAFLPAGTDFISHFTYECGNDNLMGQGSTPVPEPATMLLLGAGLVGLAGFGRKKLFK